MIKGDENFGWRGGGGFLVQRKEVYLGFSERAVVGGFALVFWLGTHDGCNTYGWGGFFLLLLEKEKMHITLSIFASSEYSDCATDSMTWKASRREKMKSSLAKATYCI